MRMNKTMMIALGTLGIGILTALATAGVDAGEKVSQGQSQNPDTGATAIWQVTELDGVFYGHFQLPIGGLMTLADTKGDPIKYESADQAEAEALAALAEQGYSVPMAPDRGDSLPPRGSSPSV